MWIVVLGFSKPDFKQLQILVDNGIGRWYHMFRWHVVFHNMIIENEVSENLELAW
jgi:hypothetical protein